jgi:hypothetical protein
MLGSGMCCSAIRPRKARQLGKSIWSGLIDAFSDLGVWLESTFGEHNAAA